MYTSSTSLTQRTRFWTDYVGSLKGSIQVEDPVYVKPFVSVFEYSRPMDVTLYDIIYGSDSREEKPRSGSYYHPLHTDIYGHGRKRYM